MKKAPVLLLLLCATLKLAAVELYVNPYIEPEGHYLGMKDIVVDRGAESIRTTGNEHIPPLASVPALLAVGEVRKALMPFINRTINSEHFTLVGGYAGYIPENIPSEQRPFYKVLFEELKQKAAFPITRIEVVSLETNKFGYGFSDGSSSVIRIRHDENDRGTVYIKAELTAFAECAVAATTLSWGDPLDNSTVEFKETEIPLERIDSLIVKTFPVKWYEIRKSKAPGEVIFNTDIKKATLVKAGMPVTIYYSRDSIRLILSGKAYNTGGFGETVTVKPENSTKKIDAAVIGYSEVTIDVQ